MSGSSSSKLWLVILPIIIVVGIVIAVKRSAPPKHGDTGEYAYTAFGIDEDGKIYKFGFSGRGLKWPVNYEGKVLKQLYGCGDCKHLFPAQPGVMTTQCPSCGSQNVGGYSEEYHGPTNAIEIRIEKQN